MLATAQTSNELFKLIYSLKDSGGLADAIKACEEAAEKDDPCAITNLGLLYECGADLEADLLENDSAQKEREKKVAALFQRAASLGYARAELELARCLLSGWGVKSDKPRAIALYRKLAKENNASALHELASCYEEGNGLKKSKKKAATYFRKAAELGHRRSAIFLARCYVRGHGVEKDLQQAIYWYRMNATPKDRGTSELRQRIFDPVGTYHHAVILQNPDRVISELKEHFAIWEGLSTFEYAFIKTDKNTRDFLSDVFLSESLSSWVQKHPLLKSENTAMHVQLAYAYFQNYLEDTNASDMGKANQHLASIVNYESLHAEEARKLYEILLKIHAHEEIAQSKIETLKTMTQVVKAHACDLQDAFRYVLSLWLNAALPSNGFQDSLGAVMQANENDLQIIMGVVLNLKDGQKFDAQKMNALNLLLEKPMIVSVAGTKRPAMFSEARGSSAKHVAITGEEDRPTVRRSERVAKLSFRGVE